MLLKFHNQTLDLSRRTAIMGIVNVSNDSPIAFSRVKSDAAITRAIKMKQDGADIIDIGAHSTATKAYSISPEEEVSRIYPVVEALSKEGIITSIDTWTPSVAKNVAPAGLNLINDVSGAQNLEMHQVAKKFGLPICIMHMRGLPKLHREVSQEYEDIENEVFDFLKSSVTSFETNTGQQAWIDPGFGFGKSSSDNLTLLRTLPRLQALNRPILVSASRKGFLSELMMQGDSQDTAELLSATLAFNALAVLKGANIIRVHDVAAAHAMVSIIDTEKQENYTPE
ncbi:MAG: dihydropteroate synthase [Dehalococcoidia bacterium]|jgi:dihydropteroate synthase|nr:dihydropteroate synthase [Dehalococcoidia bacterium]